MWRRVSWCQTKPFGEVNGLCGVVFGGGLPGLVGTQVSTAEGDDERLAGPTLAERLSTAMPAVLPEQEATADAALAAGTV